MRIDILPANTHPNLDSGAVKADSDPNQDPGPFSALIGGMASSAASRTDKIADAHAPEEEESRARKTDASPALPFALVPAQPVSGEEPPHELEPAKPTGTPAGRGDVQTLSPRQLDCRSEFSTPAQPGDDEPSRVPLTPASPGAEGTQEAAASAPVKPEDSSQRPSVAASVPIPASLVVMPTPEIADSARPDVSSGNEVEKDPAANLHNAASQVHSHANRQTGEANGDRLPGEFKAASPAVASPVDARDPAYLQTIDSIDMDAEAHLTETSVLPEPASQIEGGLPIGSDRLRAGFINSPKAFADSAVVAAMVPAPEATDPAQVAEAPEHEAPVREVPASTRTRITGAPIIGAGIQMAMTAPGRPVMLTSADGSALAKGQGARRPAAFPEIRDHEGKSRELMPGDHFADQAEAPRTAALVSADPRRVILGPDAVTDAVTDDKAGGDEPAVVRNKAEDSKRARESSAESQAPTVESADLAWVGMQSAQRLLFQNQTARVNTSEASALSAFRPVQHSISTTAAPFAGALQAGQTAGADIKSLMNLLAPRQSAPTQSADFLAQLAGRIQAQVRENQNILTIQLKPSALGRMEIKAETSAAGVLATITTESAKVRDFIEQNLTSLQQSFQDQGIKVDRISVTVQDGSLHQSTAGQQESHANPSGNSAFGTYARVSDDFELAAEELALDQQTLLALNPHSTFHAIA
jgi:hypothetical protein